ncbi:hypothetical protein Tco_0850191 [Tanacetum coccineum]
MIRSEIEAYSMVKTLEDIVRMEESMSVDILATIKSLKKPCIAGFMKPINSTPPPTPPLHHHSPLPKSSSMIVTPSTPKPTTTKSLYYRMPSLLVFEFLNLLLEAYDLHVTWIFTSMN